MPGTPGGRLVALLALLLALGVVGAPEVSAEASADTSATVAKATVQNFTADGRQQTRFDTAGDAIDAHDGQIAQFGETYYLYGTSYDCGYQWQHNDDFCGFKVYTSPDLETWTDRGFVATPRDCTFCFRPHVVYNESTRTYVMWVNDQDALDNFRVYTSDRPTGPFTEMPEPDLPVATPCTADLGLFVDHDGTGYLTCSNAGWHVAVLELTDDYLQPTGRFDVIGVTRVEAPALFEKDGRYYLTMSDPNCGYCAATGTSYVTAPSPLGPWTGVDAWTVSDGVLDVRGGLYGLSADSDEWTDYTFSFDVAPQLKTDGRTVQAGWSVRMIRPDNGYLFLLSDGGSTGGRLTVLERAGATVTSRTIQLAQAIRPGEWHSVSVQTAGSRITTSVDGVVVDSFTDTTYAKGGVGFREFNGANLESASFDNATVTSASGDVLLEDDFSSPDLAAWVPPVAGRKISNDSCGGQPAHVATLTGTNGQPVHLFFSDLWNFHTNEALANYYWEPLSFDQDGEIQPLRCGNHTVDVDTGPAGHAAQPMPSPGLDQTSGSEGFSPACPVTESSSVRQTFTVGRTGPLTGLRVTAFKDGTEKDRVLRNPPTAPLDARLVALAPDGSAGTELWSGSVGPEDIGWSARQVDLRPSVRVDRGQQLALVLSTESVQGCYGVETSTLDPYSRGSASTAGDAPALPAGSDLKFDTRVGGPPGEAPPPPTSPRAGTAVRLPDDVPVLPYRATRVPVRVTNLEDRRVTVPVSAQPSDGFEARVSRPRLELEVGETRAVVVEVTASSAAPDTGTLTVHAGATRVETQVTRTDDVVRTATMGASSTRAGWSPSRTNDGDIRAQHDYAVWNGGQGWNNDVKGTFPDVLTASWPEPVTLSTARMLTLDAPQTPAAAFGVRDYDVQVRAKGVWTTVAEVRGNTAATVESTFPEVTASALRLVVRDSNDHGYSRVIALEAYAT